MIAFREFYLDRLAKGLPVENPKARMARVVELSQAEIQRLILEIPFRKSAQRRFVDYGRDVARVRFAPALWSRMSREEWERLREASLTSIDRYFAAVPTYNGKISDKYTDTGIAQVCAAGVCRLRSGCVAGAVRTGALEQAEPGGMGPAARRFSDVNRPLFRRKLRGR